MFQVLGKDGAQQDTAFCPSSTDAAARVHQEVYIFTAHLPTNNYFQIKCFPWHSPICLQNSSACLNTNRLQLRRLGVNVAHRHRPMHPQPQPPQLLCWAVQPAAARGRSPSPARYHPVSHRSPSNPSSPSDHVLHHGFKPALRHGDFNSPPRCSEDYLSCPR